jgi:4-carboxymuconolactone decarboxylase
MARLPAATDRESVSDSARPFYDQMVEARWTVRGPIAHMLPYAPEAAAGAVFLGNTLRRNSTLTPAQTELAICVAARARNQPYVWAAHSPTALANGVSPDVIDIVNARGPLDSVSDDDALIIQFGRELLEQHDLSDAIFDKARARFGETGFVELSALMGYYMLIDTIITAMGIVPAADAPKLSGLS